MVTKQWVDVDAMRCPNCCAIAGRGESESSTNGITTRIYSCSRCDAFWAVEFSEGNFIHANTLANIPAGITE